VVGRGVDSDLSARDLAVLLELRRARDPAPVQDWRDAIAHPSTTAPTPRQALPSFSAGQRIGLFGGSFNPPHAAHRAVSLFALKRLGLDAVWWLVSPGNPLKDISALHALDARMAAATALARHPRIKVSRLEAVIDTHYTADTLSYLRRHCPEARFVWLMGADNLVQFHRWDRWREIAELMPFAVVDRPPLGLRALVSPAARALAAHRLPEWAARTLAGATPPAWVFLTGLRSSLSSTALRNPDGSWKS
jgi:nicotinate-nucleotide adenylyltransferase